MVEGAHPGADAKSDFDFDTGNAGIEVIIPTVIPALVQTTTLNDAPIVLRHTTLITNAWFDAIAPYHHTAVGVYARLGRRPAGEAATNRNKNIAMFYASYRLLKRLMPRFTTKWGNMLRSVGLDPDNASENLATPAGIGNVAGRQVAAARERDGMNQLGDEGGTVFNRRPYEDYTNYRPVNTAYTLFHPSRWQPLLITSGDGTFTIQQFATPQWGITQPYSYDRRNRLRAPEPSASNIVNLHDYKAQADEVIAIQAGLTDMEKMTAELFDNKIFSLGFAALFITQSRGLSLDEFVHYDFLTNMAASPHVSRRRTRRTGFSTRSRACRLEQLDRIPVGILDLDLPAAGAGFHLVAKMQSGLLQFSDERREVSDPQNDTVPTAWHLLLSVGQWPRAGRARAAEENLRAAKGNAGERRKLLVLHRESEVLRIEGDGASHVLHLVANTMNVLHERPTLDVTQLCSLNHMTLPSAG